MSWQKKQPELFKKKVYDQAGPDMKGLYCRNNGPSVNWSNVGVSLLILLA